MGIQLRLSHDEIQRAVELCDGVRKEKRAAAAAARPREQRPDSSRCFVGLLKTLSDSQIPLTTLDFVLLKVFGNGRIADIILSTICFYICGSDFVSMQVTERFNDGRSRHSRGH